MLNLEDETKKKLNISTTEELFHKLNIITGICEDDEREWRGQKYGVNTQGSLNIQDNE